MRTQLRTIVHLSLIICCGLLFLSIKYGKHAAHDQIRQTVTVAKNPNSSHETIVAANNEVEFDPLIRDVHITVKTTKGNHWTRLKLLLDTWLGQAISHVMNAKL